MIPTLATAAVYCLASMMPDAPLAFYVARGWLGVLFAWALLKGWKITAWQFAAVAAWEMSSAICGGVFMGLQGASSLCDAGTGLPITWPSLALTVLACLPKISGGRNG